MKIPNLDELNTLTYNELKILKYHLIDEIKEDQKLIRQVDKAIKRAINQ